MTQLVIMQNIKYIAMYIAYIPVYKTKNYYLFG